MKDLVSLKQPHIFLMQCLSYSSAAPLGVVMTEVYGSADTSQSSDVSFLWSCIFSQTLAHFLLVQTIVRQYRSRAWNYCGLKNPKNNNLHPAKKYTTTENPKTNLTTNQNISGLLKSWSCGQRSRTGAAEVSTSACRKVHGAAVWNRFK